MKKEIAAKYSKLRHRFVYGQVGSISEGKQTIAYYRNSKDKNYYAIIKYIIN